MGTDPSEDDNAAVMQEEIVGSRQHPAKGIASNYLPVGSERTVSAEWAAL